MAEHHRIRALLSVLAVLVLSACGSSSPAVVTITQSASTGQSASPSSTATATSTTSTQPAVSGPAPCRAAGLALSFLGQEGATGHGELGFALRNIGAGSCRTFGFPGVLFLDRSGAALPTVSTRTTHDFFGSAPEAALVIDPTASVSFRLGVTHGINSTAGCTTAYGLQVIPPNDTATLRVSIPQGAYECRTATVSPLRPGNSAYP